MISELLIARGMKNPAREPAVRFRGQPARLVNNCEGATAILAPDESGHKIAGDDNRIAGDDNRIAGDDNRIAGDDNRIAGDDNRIAGDDNRLGPECESLPLDTGRLVDFG